MGFDYIKAVVVIGGHLDKIPVLLEAASKAREAKNCVEVVDAIVPVQYAGARIADEVRESAFSSDYGDFDTQAAKVCEAYNSLPAPAGEATTKKLLTIENLRSIIELIGIIAALFPRK